MVEKMLSDDEIVKKVFEPIVNLMNENWLRCKLAEFPWGTNIGNERWFEFCITKALGIKDLIPYFPKSNIDLPYKISGKECLIEVKGACNFDVNYVCKAATQYVDKHIHIGIFLAAYDEEKIGEVKRKVKVIEQAIITDSKNREWIVCVIRRK